VLPLSCQKGVIVGGKFNQILGDGQNWMIYAQVWMDLIGFSQGAALSYTLAILYPDRVRAIAALSGFLPEGVMELLAKRPLDGKAVYITHGRQDDKIPVAQARSTVDMLRESGAQVTYCESDGGHKVDPDCFNGLADFFS
jgi:phospholipase/carboxylesterase